MGKNWLLLPNARVTYLIVFKQYARAGAEIIWGQTHGHSLSVKGAHDMDPTAGNQLRCCLSVSAYINLVGGSSCQH